MVYRPGTFTWHLAIKQPTLFSATSFLAIEVESDSGPVTGHDQLTSNMNPWPSMYVTGPDWRFWTCPWHQYTVLTYPVRTGTFLLSSLLVVTYNTTNTTITYNPTFFDVCANDMVLNTTPMLCAGVANYTVSALGTPTPTLTYTFSGATIGSGNGTGTGLMFNEGVTTVTIIADNGCSSDTCFFMITVNDVELPILECPDNIIVSNDPGLCGADVEFIASATDNVRSNRPLILRLVDPSFRLALHWSLRQQQMCMEIRQPAHLRSLSMILKIHPSIVLKTSA